MFFWVAFLMDLRGFWTSFWRALGGQTETKLQRGKIWNTYVLLKSNWCFQGFRPSKKTWTSIKHRIQKRNAFWDDVLKLFAHFWEAFGRQNIEKRLSEIWWRMNAMLEGVLGMSSGGPAECAERREDYCLAFFGKSSLFWARAPCRGRRIQSLCAFRRAGISRLADL